VNLAHSNAHEQDAHLRTILDQARRLLQEAASATAITLKASGVGGKQHAKHGQGAGGEDSKGGGGGAEPPPPPQQQQQQQVEEAQEMRSHLLALSSADRPGGWVPSCVGSPAGFIAIFYSYVCKIAISDVHPLENARIMDITAGLCCVRNRDVLQEHGCLQNTQGMVNYS